jgi:hypothetical protein
MTRVNIFFIALQGNHTAYLQSQTFKSPDQIPLRYSTQTLSSSLYPEGGQLSMTPVLKYPRIRGDETQTRELRIGTDSCCLFINYHTASTAYKITQVHTDRTVTNTSVYYTTGVRLR